MSEFAGVEEARRFSETIYNTARRGKLFTPDIGGIALLKKNCSGYNYSQGHNQVFADWFRDSQEW